MKSIFRLSVFCFVMQLLSVEATFAQVKSLVGRIAISSDGNAHDRDDIGATPIGLAMLAEAGFQNKLVHYGYNSHIWFDGKPGQTQEQRREQKRAMTESTLGAAQRFGFNTNDFYSVTDDPDLAYNRLRDEINRSTAQNPLYILVGGPYHHVCMAIRRSQQGVRRHVTVINHGDSNPYHQHNGSCVEAEVRRLGIKYVDILNQNDYGFKGSYTRWNWLQNHRRQDLRWVHSRMKVSFPGRADVSDAGMVWYLITGGPLKNGDQRGNPEKLRNFFD